MDSKDKDKRLNELQTLIQSIYKSPPEQAVDELLKHSMRIMNSFIGSGPTDDFPNAKQKTLEKVRVNAIQISKLYPNDSKTLLKTQDLLQKISRSRTLTRKADMLKLLAKISDLNSNAT
jgi:hypothetical protein